MMVLYQPLQRKAAAASLPKGRAQVRIQKKLKKVLDRCERVWYDIRRCGSKEMATASQYISWKPKGSRKKVEKST